MKPIKPNIQVLVMAWVLITVTYFMVWVVTNYKLVPKIEVEP